MQPDKVIRTPVTVGAIDADRAALKNQLQGRTGQYRRLDHADFDPMDRAPLNRGARDIHNEL